MASGTLNSRKQDEHELQSLGLKNQAYNLLTKDSGFNKK